MMNRKPALRARPPAARRRFFPVGTRLAAVALTFFCLAFGVFATSPAAEELEPVTSVPAPETGSVAAALLIRTDTGDVLYEKSADTPRYPGPTVKLMAGILAAQRLADRMDESVTLTSGMIAGATGRRLGLVAGQTLTVRDLLYAAFCGSYNDAVYAVACLAGGSVEQFVADMNVRAEKLSCAGTRYVNPTGVHHPDMVTTPRDTAVIAGYAAKNPVLMEILSAPEYTIPGGSFPEGNPAGVPAGEDKIIYNYNLLLSETMTLYRNGWCRGLNAGMTDQAGWCVSTVYEKNGLSFLCVVMGGRDPVGNEENHAYNYVLSLLNWAGKTYGRRRLISPGEALETRTVRMTGLSTTKTVLTVPDGLYAILPDTVNTDTDVEYRLTLGNGEVTAPLRAGQVVGRVTALYNGEPLASSDVICSDGYAASGFLTALNAVRAYFGSRPFAIALVLLAVLLLGTVLSARKRGNGKRRKRGIANIGRSSVD